MKMKKNRGIVSLVIVAAVVCLLAYTCISGFGPTGTGSAKNIKLGLDLAGGVSITYQTVESNPSSEDMSDTIYKLQKRVENYSTEATVNREGDNRINIAIPGVSDANTILAELGKPGSLYFVAPTDVNGNSTFEQDATAESGYALLYTEEELEAAGAIVIHGTDVADAQAGSQRDSMNNNEYVVQLSLTEEGKSAFATATSENIGQQIAIVYDGQIISAPTVQEAITDGECVINGMDTIEEAENLASSIRIGGLSLELEEISSNVVGAQLGQDAISTSLKAALIGILLVMIIMCVVYRVPGLAAAIALTIYIGLDLFLLNAFNLTLTLPGIAGIILSIGMAVDANVIIFARVKEEIGSGKPVAVALQTGFKKALSAIVDGNVTTLIAAIVLGIKGSGTVKGFAQTLALGIILSMFTALVVTRQILYALYAIGLKKANLYGETKETKTVDFLGKRKIFLSIAGVIIVIGLVFMGVNKSKDNGAFNYSLEFVGGTSTSVSFNEDYSLEELNEQVVPVFEETLNTTVQVQKVAGGNEVIFKTKSLTLEEREAVNTALEANFGVTEENIKAENISGTVSKEMRSDAITAVIIAVLCMLVYIWFRFKDFRFASSAVVALLHDVLIVLAAYAVLRISVGNTFIAVMLTIVGYSINATIVIFDRIREKLGTSGSKADLKALVNESVTQTLSRSIYTSLTTFVTVFMLYIMGVTSIKEFALPLMIGIIAGGFSSVCLTGAIWYMMRTATSKKNTK